MPLTASGSLIIKPWVDLGFIPMLFVLSKNWAWAGWALSQNSLSSFARDFATTLYFIQEHNLSLKIIEEELGCDDRCFQEQPNKMRNISKICCARRFDRVCVWIYGRDRYVVVG
jgi:hypothetical protein